LHTKKFTKTIPRSALADKPLERLVRMSDKQLDEICKIWEKDQDLVSDALIPQVCFSLLVRYQDLVSDALIPQVGYSLLVRWKWQHFGLEIRN
jgi:hypothetical protein